MKPHAGIALLAIALGACQTRTLGQAPMPPPALLPLFGPVVGPEVIGGRAEDDGGVVWILAGRHLVRVDVDARRVQRTLLKIGPGESCWGLARLQDGSMWTLKGRQSIIRVEADGAVSREIRLPGSHLGLFASGDRLVYQEAEFTPPAVALKAGLPGDDHPQPWSQMTTRAFATLARGSAVALNMVSCGSSRRAERACWFPDEAAVSLIDPAGGTRRVTLAGLDVVAPEVLLTAENPPRPVRDAYIDEGGTLWVLSSGKPLSGAANQPGGWILARYGPRGEPLGVRLLPESARLILRAWAGRALLLTGGGMVAEVIP